MQKRWRYADRISPLERGLRGVLALLFILTLQYSFAESNRSLFETANSYYQNKQYEQAEHFYLQVLQRDPNNMNAAYNLGNTCYHLHKYPEAILYYEKAKKLQPDNKYIEQNLSITNNKLFSKIEFSKEFFVTQYSKNFLNSKSSGQWARWMLVCLWGSVFLFCLYFFSKNKLPLRTGVMLLILSILFAGLTYSRFQEEKMALYAIVFKDQAHLQKTPVSASRVIDSIQAGIKIKLLDRDAGWAKIELPNGKTGWIENKDLEPI